MKSINKNKLVVEKNFESNGFLKFIPLIICFFLLLTQYIFSVKFGGRKIYIYFIEIFLMFSFLLALFDKFKNKKKVSIPKNKIIFLILFVLWFGLLTIYRYCFYHDITGGFIIFRVLFLPLLFVCLLYEYKVPSKSILMGLVIFTSLINATQVHNIIVNDSFRYGSALKNINIYLCYAISVIPILCLALRNSKKIVKNGTLLNIFRIFVYLNIVLIFVFSLFSGSRIAFVLCPGIMFMSYFFVNKFSVKSVVSFLLLLSVGIIMVAGIIFFNFGDSRYNIRRSSEPILKFLHLNMRSGSNPNEGIVEEPHASEINVVESNDMRNLLWKKSIYYIKVNPIFGKSSNDIEIDMGFNGLNEPVKCVQSPHNFILEFWLALGLPGLLMYLFIIAWFVYRLFRQNKNIYLKFNALLSLFAIYTFSFFQPLVTSYFVISLTLFMCAYIYFREENENESIMDC